MEGGGWIGGDLMLKYDYFTVGMEEVINVEYSRFPKWNGNGIANHFEGIFEVVHAINIGQSVPELICFNMC